MNPLPSLVHPVAIKAMCEAAASTPDGAFLEVGVYQGGTAWHLQQVANRQARPLYLFDTFEGLPYDEPADKHRKGEFADTSYEAIVKALPDAMVFSGVFPLSAPRNLSHIAFAHLDVDQYQAYMDSCRYLLPRMVRGGIIWFDDADCIPNANRAVTEFFGAQALRKHKCGKLYVVC